MDGSIFDDMWKGLVVILILAMVGAAAAAIGIEHGIVWLIHHIHIK